MNDNIEVTTVLSVDEDGFAELVKSDSLENSNEVPMKSADENINDTDFKIFSRVEDDTATLPTKLPIINSNNLLSDPNKTIRTKVLESRKFCAYTNNSDSVSKHLLEKELTDKHKEAISNIVKISEFLLKEFENGHIGPIKKSFKEEFVKKIHNTKFKFDALKKETFLSIVKHVSKVLNIK